jgi:hypothetical protein
VYPVRKTERSDAQRGLWYLSSGQKKPNDYSEEVPGSWHLDLYYDNNDVFNQKWNTAFNPGGTDDYVAIFDANRRWEGSPDLLDSGGYDGVAIHLPVKITAARFDLQSKNPNSMAAIVATSRQENGAATWLHEYTNTTAYTTLTNVAIQNVTLEADSYGFGLFVIPNGTDEIGTGWAGDDGSATSATATTLTDTSKEWIADQFIGGTVKIVSGVGAGASEAITDNGTNSITVASWSNGTPDDTSRYRIINKDYVATGRNHTYMHLTLDQSALVCSAVSAETPAFVLYRDLLLNTVGPTPTFTETEIQRVTINPETTGRYIVVLADEALVIDGETMRAWVADTGTDEELRTVSPWAYSVLEVAADGSRRAALHWLRVNPGDHSITLASDETGVACTVDVEFTEAIYS